MIGRTGGAPTFAVGMAQMFAGAFGSRARPGALVPLRDHVRGAVHPDDASTPGRAWGASWCRISWRLPGSRSANTRSLAAAISSPPGSSSPRGAGFSTRASSIRYGGINSLWPIFGIANQLLAVIALALGTDRPDQDGPGAATLGHAAPLAWLLAVTMTAGWMKIFSPNPRLGFLAGARGPAGKARGRTLAPARGGRADFQRPAGCAGDRALPAGGPGDRDRLRAGLGAPAPGRPGAGLQRSPFRGSAGNGVRACRRRGKANSRRVAAPGQSAAGARAVPPWRKP